MLGEALRNKRVSKRSKKQESVGLIDFCRGAEKEMPDDMAMLLAALLGFGFHLECLN